MVGNMAKETYFEIPKRAILPHTARLGQVSDGKIYDIFVLAEGKNRFRAANGPNQLGDFSAIKRRPGGPN